MADVVPWLDAIRARLRVAVLPPESASGADLREIFAASARDVPELLAEVERLRAQRDAALALNVWRQNDGTTWVLADALRRALGARPS